jgi:hypothetical protein
MHSCKRRLIAYDGDEGFLMEAVEALLYEVVRASTTELLQLEQAQYRLLKPAADFQFSRERRPRRRHRPPCSGGGHCQ